MMTGGAAGTSAAATERVNFVGLLERKTIRTTARDNGNRIAEEEDMIFGLRFTYIPLSRILIARVESEGLDLSGKCFQEVYRF